MSSHFRIGEAKGGRGREGRSSSETNLDVCILDDSMEVVYDGDGGWCSGVEASEVLSVIEK